MLRDWSEKLGILDKYRMKERKERVKTKKTGKAKRVEPGVSEADFERIEFHRQGLALFPDRSDRRPGIAILVESGTTGLRQRYCSCSISATRTCAHILKLVKVNKALAERLGGKTFEEDFRSSIWYRLAEIMADGCRERPETVRMQSLGSDDKRVIKVCGSSGEEMLYYMTDGPGRSGFLERCGKVPDGDSIPSRGTVLQRLALMTLTESHTWRDSPYHPSLSLCGWNIPIYREEDSPKGSPVTI